MSKKLYAILVLILINQCVHAIEVHWSLQPSYTVRDGVWIFTDNNVSTPVQASFTITRKLLGSLPNGDPYFEPVNLILNVVTYKQDGTRIVHYSRAVTSSEFPKNRASLVYSNINFNTKPLDLSREISGPVNGVYYNGQGVFLEHSTDGGANFDWSGGKIYNPVTPNGYYASVVINEGDFVNVVQTGAVHIRIGNSLHPICCPDVLTGIFNFNMNMIKHIGSKKLQEFNTGTSIDKNTSIIHYQGGLYLKQGNLVRLITSPEAFNKYHFKFVYTDVSNLNGLTIGDHIY